MNAEPKYWVVIPAAGAGRRMRSDVPKQYLRIAGKTVIEHTLTRLMGHPRIHGGVVALSEEDACWDALELDFARPLLRAAGGPERCDSVLNALRRLAGEAAEHDWVLVHDAARPCVRHADIDALMQAVTDEHGGLLAVPVRDTMKRADTAGRSSATVDRTTLWHALTPQMFRLGDLLGALEQARERGLSVTDDASAMEMAGYRPLLVQGQGDNIKITRPEDLQLADFYLREQQGL